MCNNSAEYPKNEIPHTKLTTISVLSPKEEKDFIVRKISMEVNGSMPNHTNKIQHQQYVLSGEAKVIIGNETYHAKQGDFIYIPANVNHSYETCYGVGYEFLCMITTHKDTITML